MGLLASRAGLPQSRQLLAGTFWPGSGDAQALTNLRRELHHLRRLLGDDGSLEVTPTELVWHDTATCRVDVRVLETAGERVRAVRRSDPVLAARLAAEGVAAYGGDFLPAVYDEWVLPVRDRLRRCCVELCDVLSEPGASRADSAVVLAAARRRIELEPLEEVGYRALIRLQVELDDRAGALSTYHHCVSVLERELGVAPAPETERIGEALVRGARTRPSRPRAGLAQWPLVGREQQVDRLVAAWEAGVRDRRPRVVVVRGDAGVGKTRLVAEVADRVRAQHGVVATAQCFDIRGPLVLSPVADWLRSPDLAAARRGLEPRWRQEVERLVPDGLGPAPDSPPGAAGDRSMVDAWQRQRFFEGLVHAVLAVDRPLLLVLDNLQWCDEETLSWLGFLLTSSTRAPVTVLATLRDEGRGDGPARWLGGLRAAGLVTELTLGPLEPGDTATLSAAVTGRAVSEEEARLLHAATGGFALLVIEAARAGGARASDASPAERLGVVLEHRIEQTSPQAQEIAGLAAALGRDFTLDLLTEASDLDADAVVHAVDELWRRRIVRERGEGYDFTHDLLRDAAYAAVSPPHRWLLHRRLAQALELSDAAADDTVATLLAEQYERGGRPERALPHYRRAADVAARRFAFPEAIRLHRRVLRIIASQPPGRPRDERELEALLSVTAPLNAVHGYASPELRTVLERAVELAEGIGTRRLLVASLLSLWASRFVQGDVIDAHRLISRALAVSEVDDVLLGEAHFAFAGSALSLGRPAEAVTHFDIAHDRCRGAESLAVGTRPEVHALAWAAHADWLLGRTDQAEERAAEAIDRAREFAHPYSLAVALAYGAVTHQLLGRRDAVATTVEELSAVCGRYGFAYYSHWALVLDGWLQGGEPGLVRLHEGLGNLRAESSLARMPYWLSLQADVLARDGRHLDALAVLDAAQAAAGQHGDAWWLPEIERRRAWYATGEARVRGLRSALDLAERQGSTALAERSRADLAAANDANAAGTARP